jgi:hypothetical protein
MGFVALALPNAQTALKQMPLGWPNVVLTDINLPGSRFEMVDQWPAFTVTQHDEQNRFQHLKGWRKLFGGVAVILILLIASTRSSLLLRVSIESLDR